MNQITRRSMRTNSEAEAAKVRQLKKGKFFRLNDSATAPVWVRGEYVPAAKKFNTHKYDDVNHEKLRKGGCVVFVGFTF